MNKSIFRHWPLLVSIFLVLASPSVWAANPGAHYTKWEYTCFAEDDVKDIIRRANNLGKRGWEMTASNLREFKSTIFTEDIIWCFKRGLDPEARVAMREEAVRDTIDQAQADMAAGRHAEALKSLRVACNGGEARACFVTGQLLESGKLGKKSGGKRQAKRYYELACEKGVEEACEKLKPKPKTQTVLQ